MNTAPMAGALRNVAAKVRQIEVQTSSEHDLLRDAADLLRVMAALMEGVVPIRAFGPPGDWGYETEVGHAVIALRTGTCAGSADAKAAPL